MGLATIRAYCAARFPRFTVVEITDLADRVRVGMGQLPGIEERPVMNGLGFFVDDRMVVAVLDGRLCLQLDGRGYHDRLLDEGVERYLFAGRPVPGWLSVDQAVLDDRGLASWIELALDSRS